MIQHRSASDRSGVMHGMDETGLAHAGCVAAVMRGLENARSNTGE
jgi:hypothetical protein